jgi:hypothetical protein
VALTAVGSTTAPPLDPEAAGLLPLCQRRLHVEFYVEAPWYGSPSPSLFKPMALDLRLFSN